MRAIRRLLPVIATYRGRFVETVVWSVVVQGAILAIALGLAAVVGRVVTGSGDDLPSFAVVLALLCTVVAASTWRESWVSHDLAYRLIGVLRGRVFTSLRRALPSRNRPRRTGDLVSTLVTDIETLEWLYAHTVAQTLSAVLVLSASAVVSLMINPMLLAVWLPLLLVGIAVPLCTARIAARDGAALAAGSGRVRSELLDTMRGLRELRGADALEARMDHISSEVRMLARVQVRDASRVGMERGIADLTLAAAAIGAVSIALFAGSLLDPADIPLAVAVSVAGLGPAAQIIELLRGAGMLRASAERIVETFDQPPSTGASLPSADPRDERGLVLDRVCFSYDGTTSVLDGFDLHVRPGETVALVGQSGVGKTTAARLILRLWDPDAGAVRVDGIDIRSLPDQDLRRLVAVVPQSSPLLRGTIGSNITLGDPDATQQSIRRAATAAGLLSAESALPLGLETPIGEHGTGLSGGQRARVAIARALLKDPRVLVLDEATASLDPEADEAILELLRRDEDRAILLIAHRPATIAASDRQVHL
ncbi:ABC transporter ATP-binding protein [Microbacterium sp.]|uniref:ABC transporter ATP-binding protein n=1 Tax=Microbacterium sp. TaxID=51671 RepID=UPI00273471E7|nr:ABC transporter ATP-binding protein [Microbacterium sp.]MDP3952176.1 ABC transporter ATP-binding protein [Microbacterium sp.]